MPRCNGKLTYCTRFIFTQLNQKWSLCLRRWYFLILRQRKWQEHFLWLWSVSYVPFFRCRELQVTVKMADLHRSQVIFRALVAWVTGDTQYTATIPPEVRTMEWVWWGFVSCSVTVVINEVNWNKLGFGVMAGFVGSLNRLMQSLHYSF